MTALAICAYLHKHTTLIMTRWTIVIPEKTNRMLRTHLAIRGAKKGDLSKFVDKAVRQTLFREAVAGVKDRNAADSDLIEAAIEEAIERSSETRS